MPKAMILTVGTGTRPDSDIVAPLAKTVKDSDPDYVVLLVSADSKKYGEAVMQQTTLKPEATYIWLIGAPDDVQAVFVEALKALRHIRARGYEGEQIVADYTSGTKAMTAGLVLAAVSFRCASLKYITGVRKDGVVVGGTEKFLSIPPSAVLAVQDLHEAQQLLLQMRFDASADVLSRINDALLDESDRELKEALQTIAKAYQEWDLFNHKRFVGEYNKIRWLHPELKPFQLKDRTLPKRLIAMAEELEKQEIPHDLLADLFSNAVRRAAEGRYDDAVARLYRLVELVAQQALKRHGILAEDVNLEKVPVPAVERLQMFSALDLRDGKIKIGLHDGYWLLGHLGENLGKAFQTNKRFTGLLQTRNESILAHGTKPVRRGDFEALQREVEHLCTMVDPGFQTRCFDFQFPWIAKIPKNQI